ncbi:MAG: divergent polysaccharide deacetylase family protein [Acetobacteraceae bacterium]
MVLADRLRDFFVGWRGLRRFWYIVLGILTLGALTLQALGPPAPAHNVPVATAPVAVAPPPPPPQPQEPAVRVVQPKPVPLPPADRPGRDSPGMLADPDPALQDPVPGSDTEFLPRISRDGRMPMQVYAAAFDHQTQRVRVGLVVAGIGMNEADSLAAVRTLPAGVTLAISPYAGSIGKVLSAARMTEHEYLISIPMEPQGFPLNDPGGRALMTSLSPQDNMERLRWVLSRIGGYVGATNALGAMSGERFSGMADQMGTVLTDLQSRGLLFVDARPGQPRSPLLWNRSVDLVIDDPPGRDEIDARLAELSRLARDRGSALGLATAPRPVTVDRIAAWSNSLRNNGLVLAPVSALVEAPPKSGKPNP